MAADEDGEAMPLNFVNSGVDHLSYIIIIGIKYSNITFIYLNRAVANLIY